MKKLDDTKPTPQDGLNTAGILTEIRIMKAVINDIIDAIDKKNKMSTDIKRHC